MNAVEKFVANLPKEKRDIVERLREVIKKALPDAVETLKWGNPNYAIGKRNIAAIGTYSSHVNLYLYNGAQLKSKLLTGTGKGMRHVSIMKLSDIAPSAFAKLLKLAAELN